MFAPFFKMLKMRVPKGAVAQKMVAAGLDPAVLDMDPDGPSPSPPPPDAAAAAASATIPIPAAAAAGTGTSTFSWLPQGGLMAMFTQIDADGNGTLDAQELCAGLKKFGMAEEQCDELMKLADRNNDEKLSLMEFMQGVKKYQKAHPEIDFSGAAADTPEPVEGEGTAAVEAGAAAVEAVVEGE